LVVGTAEYFKYKGLISNWAQARRLRNEPHCGGSGGLVKFDTRVQNFCNSIGALRPPLGGSGGAKPTQLECEALGSASPTKRAELVMSRVQVHYYVYHIVLFCLFPVLQFHVGGF